MASDVTVTTALMGMVLPVVGQSPGPLYAQDINAALQTVVDVHNHTPGSGAQIAPAALNINADLAFASAGISYRITSLKATAYTDQGGALSASYTGHLYDNGGDLWWNNGAGVGVRITAGNALNAASIRGIGGDYGTDPNANAIYTTSIKTFTFTQSAGVAAKMAVGDLLIYDTAGGANAVTLKNPGGLTGAYTMTLPTALPANNNNTNLLQVSSAGALSTTQQPQFADPRVRDGSGSYYFQIQGSVSSLAAPRNAILPVLTADDTFAMLAAAQTLTNKTLTSPAIAGPTLTGTLTGPYTLSGTATGGTYSGIALAGATALSGTFTGQFQGADGTAAAPAYSFGAETGTGWYRAGSHQLGLSLAGTQRALFNDATGNGSALLNLASPASTGAALAWSGNSPGIYPPQGSGAFNDNFSNGDGEVDSWNTNIAHTASATSFRFYQQTGASAATLLAALDGNGNLLLGGLTAAPANLTHGILLAGGSSNAFPSAGAVALISGSDTLGGGKSAFYALNEAGANWQLGGGAPKTIAAIGLDLVATYVSGTGTAGTANTAGTVKSVTVKANSLNANPRSLRARIVQFVSSYSSGTITLNIVFAGNTFFSYNFVSSLFMVVDVIVTYLSSTTVQISGFYAAGAAFGLIGLASVAVGSLASDQSLATTQSGTFTGNSTTYAILVEQMG